MPFDDKEAYRMKGLVNPPDDRRIVTVADVYDRNFPLFLVAGVHATSLSFLVSVLSGPLR